VCDLQLDLGDADESKATGIQMLLSDHDKTIALVPEGNERHTRRDD
jgi:lysine 2,3-aminomutase